MEKDQIKWAKIQSALERLEKDQKWLGDALGIGKAAISNWRDRGHAPASRAKALASILRTSVDELLGYEEYIDAPKKHEKIPLSDEARELILCVTRLDSLGEIPRRMFELHKGLLLLSVASTELEDLLTGRKRLDEAEDLLNAPGVIAEGQRHAAKKQGS